MMPASYSQLLPFGKDLNPFEIYFLVPKMEIDRYREFVNNLNEDLSVTGGVFTFRIFGRELLENDNKYEKILKLLGNSDIIARIIHPDDGMVHVEHFFIGLDWGTEEKRKEEVRLFLLQVCRANLDEIRQELQFPTERFIDSDERDVYENALKEFEDLFQKLSNFYSHKIDNFSVKRLRPLRFSKPSSSILPKRSRSSNNNNFGNERMFLSFEVSSAFWGFEEKKSKKKFINNLNITQNSDGSFNLDFDTLKKILLEGKFMQPKEEISNLKLSVFNNLNVNYKADRFPILRVEIGDQKIDIPFKNHEGTILYIATLLKQHFGYSLKREEIINIFKNIPPEDFPPINSENIEEYISDTDKEAYDWLKKIYCSIFEEESKSDYPMSPNHAFNQWFYKMYRNGCDDPFKTGLNQLKQHIKDDMEDAGFGLYTPYVMIESYIEGRNKEYSLKLIGENIFFKERLSQLLQATKNYIVSQKEAEE